ncbi:nuclear RNA export factor, putative [Entamoeba invadens IP1]|uniref:Nuclear RNA export factor, putative n=1 Tax=Entamoeba invadens IP1 TaxID=370355 RepID=A0A0A1UFJ3_ENTIV|nr:nuclear RNA export factor, putative [Entamoeba invadens IP1]ELP91683.1 nuclear RNA export factor, putative [Entamoeba invadens IP1]|eukprot:XP_004258454.1 nuclear RNA export factor, putative [Entamoeba invadens IP1]
MGGNKRKQKFQKPNKNKDYGNKLKLIVSGFTGTTTQLSSFFSSNGIHVNVKFISETGGNFQVNLKDKTTANNILGLNGILFNSQIVTISMVDNSAPSVNFNEMGMKLVDKYYSTNDQSINLDNIQMKVKDLGFNKQVDSIVITRILDGISTIKPAIQSIHFCNNSISSLLGFQKIIAVFPALKSLDFRNNCIKQLDQLDYIKDIPLEALSLNGNPIQNEPNYHFQIRTHFKNLQFLDLQNFTSMFRFPVTVNTYIPDLQIGYFANYSEFSSIESFIKNYFNLFDTDPLSLSSFYTMASVFSFTATKHLKEVSEMNRNHVSHFAQDQYASRLLCGSKIAPFFANKFKPCVHNLNDINFDCFSLTLPSGLQLVNVVVFGKAKYCDRGTSNFYRTFILTMDGKIINEQLFIFSGENPFVVGKQTKEAMAAIKQVSQMTQIDPNFTVPFLKRTNYDTQRALGYINMVVTLVQRLGITHAEAFFVCDKLQWEEGIIIEAVNKFGKNLYQGVKDLQ